MIKNRDRAAQAVVERCVVVDAQHRVLPALVEVEAPRADVVGGPREPDRDGILEPEQAREIGKKASESPSASTLIGRIREVTRRRRLTAPALSGLAETCWHKLSVS